MGMNTLKIDGTTIPDLYIDTSEAFNKPKKNVETVSIPGRNGDLIIDYGTWQNVVITYPCMIKGNFETKFQALLNNLGTLSGYHKIECTNDTTHYRMGAPIVPQAPTVKRVNEDGYFDLSFNCKPQRFLVSGLTPITVSNGTTITNPTGFEAMPYLLFDNIHTYSVKLENGYSLTAAQYREVQITATLDAIWYPTLVIDSEMMECYLQGDPQPANSAVVLSPNVFPVLYGADGLNKTKITTNYNFRIQPNWWEL